MKQPSARSTTRYLTDSCSSSVPSGTSCSRSSSREVTPTKDPAVAMARHVREWRWLEVLAYGINDDGVLMLRFDWGDEYPDERENWHPWYVMTMRQFHSWCNCLRVKDSMDRPDVLCDLLEDHARRSWNSLKLTAGRKSLGKAKRASISFLLPSSYNVGCAIELLMRLMRKGLSCRVLNGEKSLVAAADGQRIADRFHRPKKPAFADFTQTMMWRLVTREEFTDVFGKEAGLYLPDRARYCPLPEGSSQQACHAICPVGHLKVAVGTIAVNSAVAILRRCNKDFIVRTTKVPYTTFKVARSRVGVSYPIVISYNAATKNLCVRYRSCLYNNADAFQHEFSVLGCRA